MIIGGKDTFFNGYWLLGIWVFITVNSKYEKDYDCSYAPAWF